MKAKAAFSELFIKKIKPLDLVIFFALIISGIFLTFNLNHKKNESITVTADGAIYNYSLKKDGVYSVKGVLGETVFEIKNGSVHIIDSPCEGKNCVHQGYTLPLVCLPNKVIITADEQGEFDAIAD